MDLATEPLPAHCQHDSECNAQPLPQQSKRFYITAENAKALRAKAMESRKRNQLAIQERLKTAESSLAAIQPLLATAVARTVQDSASYVSERLTRTRRHLEKLDAELEAADDPRAIKAISDAIARLAEVERILDNRPLPGSHSPSKRQSHPISATIEPL